MLDPPRATDAATLTRSNPRARDLLDAKSLITFSLLKIALDVELEAFIATIVEKTF